MCGRATETGRQSAACLVAKRNIPRAVRAAARTRGGGRWCASSVWERRTCVLMVQRRYGLCFRRPVPSIAAPEGAQERLTFGVGEAKPSYVRDFPVSRNAVLTKSFTRITSPIADIAQNSPLTGLYEPGTLKRK